MLTVPVNRVVTLDVVSADVAHSWWVPAFGGKIDAIPGKTNHTWFQAEKAGHYIIRCTEFCGIQHAAMNGVVNVVPKAPTRARNVGREVFEGVCASCHGLSGEGLIGPAIATARRSRIREASTAAAERRGPDAGRRKDVGRRS